MKTLASIGVRIRVTPWDSIYVKMAEEDTGNYIDDRTPFEFLVEGRLEDGQIFTASMDQSFRVPSVITISFAISLCGPTAPTGESPRNARLPSKSGHRKLQDVILSIFGIQKERNCQGCH